MKHESQKHLCFRMVAEAVTHTLPTATSPVIMQPATSTSTAAAGTPFATSISGRRGDSPPERGSSKRPCSAIGENVVRSLADQLVASQGEQPGKTQKTGDFDIQGGDIDAKLTNLIGQIKAEFDKVYTQLGQVHKENEVINEKVEENFRQQLTANNDLETNSQDAWTRQANEIATIQAAGNDLAARLAAYEIQLEEWKTKSDENAREMQKVVEQSFCTDRMVQQHVADVTEAALINIRGDMRTQSDSMATRIAKIELAYGAATAAPSASRSRSSTTCSPPPTPPSPASR